MIFPRSFLFAKVLSLFLLFPCLLYAQSLKSVVVSDKSGISTDSIALTDDSVLRFIRNKPLFSFLVDNKNISSDNFSQVVREGSGMTFMAGNILTGFIEVNNASGQGWSIDITFENISADTVALANVIPFGTDDESVYITGHGPSDLARAFLFRPRMSPLRVILPDNAWEMGYNSFPAGDGYSVCAIARRQDSEGGIKQRYQTLLPRGARVRYRIYADVYKGEWQDGLKLMFRERYLYDLEKFDNTLYERSDLAWIKESYLIILQMAWDREFFDRFTGRYTFPDLIRQGTEQFGFIDVYGIWPTWPRLGLDKRNQWDMYADLPGGTKQLGNFVRMARQSGTRFFIAYNPWDNSTRTEDHYRGMARLIGETDADGVVLDTRGSSSYELQAAADSVKKGVVMYSEGMAVIRDMPGIISGRVHNAIFLSPELNLNKLIKPDFAIFRVCDAGEDLLHREIAIAFFNGYGTELNMFRPGGRDENLSSDLDFLSKTTMILRQNNDAFSGGSWTPLVGTLSDRTYVNKWISGEKTIYTVLNMNHEGHEGKLFSVDRPGDIHYVSLWHHENIEPLAETGSYYIPVSAPGWPVSFNGTRKEGSVVCIAAFPVLLKSTLMGDNLYISTKETGAVVIWKGNPSYKTEKKEFTLAADTTLAIRNLFGYYEGKIVVQLLNGKILKDENILFLRGGKPWLVSKVEPTATVSGIPTDMVLIPGATFSFGVSPNEEFIPYPEVSDIRVTVDTFLIDRYPVTNAKYHEFLIVSGYIPTDTTNFLKHWEKGMYKQGQDDYPVVYVSYEDMKAYAGWAGKRLPTEAEWQLAAQGTDGRKWPWGNDFHGTSCNNAFDRPTPVNAFPKGQSIYGAWDMIGNVWQATGDIWFNGTNYMQVIRGGSFYKPESSWWYIQGGPQSLDHTQVLLMVSQGFDRSETVGFRCVKDVKDSGRENKQ